MIQHENDQVLHKRFRNVCMKNQNWFVCVCCLCFLAPKGTCLLRFHVCLKKTQAPSNKPTELWDNPNSCPNNGSTGINAPTATKTGNCDANSKLKSRSLTSSDLSITSPSAGLTTNNSLLLPLLVPSPNVGAWGGMMNVASKISGPSPMATNQQTNQRRNRGFRFRPPWELMANKLAVWKRLEKMTL